MENDLSDYYQQLSHSLLDTHRQTRVGFAEVIYGPGKTIPQLLEIVGLLHAKGQPVLITRLTGPRGQKVLKDFPGAVYRPESRLFFLPAKGKPAPDPDQNLPENPAFRLRLLSAGTGDHRVLMEARDTFVFLTGDIPPVFPDCGVAGLHRLTARLGEILPADHLIVVAGMDGALPSVVGGLVDIPVTAVPTSVGYGSSLNGLSALLAGLNSCSPNINIVNIDNGFAAGYQAALARRRLLGRDGKTGDV